MRLKLLITSLVFTFIASFACAESKAVEGAKEDIQSFKAEVKQSLKKVDKDLQDLTKKAKLKKNEIKEESVEEAKEARAKIDKKLSELQSKTKENWIEAKQEISEAIDRLSKKLQDSLK